jgi:hypothetical protein
MDPNNSLGRCYIVPSSDWLMATAALAPSAAATTASCTSLDASPATRADRSFARELTSQAGGQIAALCLSGAQKDGPARLEAIVFRDGSVLPPGRPPLFARP